MTDAWPSYQAVLEPEKHIIGKRWTQRIERHNLNSRTHLKRLNRKILFFSKESKIHDKVIGWYLTIHYYQ